MLCLSLCESIGQCCGELFHTVKPITNSVCFEWEGNSCWFHQKVLTEAVHHIISKSA